MLAPLGSIVVISGFFNLSYIENHGAAWGLMAGQQLFLILFSVLTLGILIWKSQSLFGSLWGRSFTMTLLFGGVIGNLIDRIRLSHVIDFLDFYWKASHFPAFNLADASICCGVFLFVLTQWQYDKRMRRRTE
jgi:signal peptidase II